MANYSGTIATYVETGVRRGEHLYNDIGTPKINSGCWIDTANPHSGTSHLRLVPGGVKSIDYGADAAALNPTVWAYAPAHGKLRMEVVDPSTGAVLGYDETSSTETWEQLSVDLSSGIAAGIYVVRLKHLGVSEMHGDSLFGDFDDLV